MKKNINTTSNNLVIAGHLAADAQVSENKNVAHFTVLRNQERDGDPVSVRLTLFAQNGGKKAYFPVKKLVKGAYVRVAAFMRNNDYTNEETVRKKVYRLVQDKKVVLLTDGPNAGKYQKIVNSLYA